jgi:hypothetical protein
MQSKRLARIPTTSLSLARAEQRTVAAAGLRLGCNRRASADIREIVSSSLLALFLAALALGACRSPASAREVGLIREPAATPASDESVPGSTPLAAETSLAGQALPANKARKAAVVVELFTSEGCSSCPAADETLAEITRDEERAGQPVYTLELHVDYWNDLGWVDPFSAALHSERQRRYAQALGLTGIYTPQMIVNGREELVGSRGALARSVIARALAKPSSVGVTVSGVRLKDTPSVIAVDYRVSSPVAVDLQLALAEDAAQTTVERGENAGRTLQHRHVVRSFWAGRVEANANGTWRAPWPASAQSQPAFLVAYAADPATRAITGADAHVLSVPN